jgi:Rrf2 family protein
MDRWLAITDGANAALHAMAYAAAKGGVVSARATAEAIAVSPSYLAKLLQELARAGLVEMSRGASGGFSVSGDPAARSCLEVILAIDGSLPERYCLFPESTCETGGCALKLLCDDIGRRATVGLGATSVADLARSY